jgi:tetratricopeptide (TPR) repeat protein
MLAALLLAGSALAMQVSSTAECLGRSGTFGSNVWERAKAPELGPYCDLLAKGSAKLANPTHIATDVVALAEQADALMPGRAAPLVLRGRALTRIGKYPEAMAAFAEAKSRDGSALEDPVALLAWARVLAYVGRSVEAHDAYRALLSRVSSLTLAERGQAYVGAGMVAMSLGPPSIDESVAVLREARKNSQDVVQRVASLALAMALDRAGEPAEAAQILAERPREDSAALLVDPAATAAMGPSGYVERSALLAFALEASDPARARSSWQTFLEGPGGAGPWVDHARKHLAKLGAPAPRGGGGR